MADDRRAQLERWREERQRAKRPAMEGRGRGPRTSALSSALQRRTTEVSTAQITAQRTNRPAKAPRVVNTRKQSDVASRRTPRPSDESVVKQQNGSDAVSNQDKSRRESSSSMSPGGLVTSPAENGTKPNDGDDDTSVHRLRKQQRRTSGALPSPSNETALGGDAKRVVPTRSSLTPSPKPVPSSAGSTPSSPPRQVITSSDPTTESGSPRLLSDGSRTPPRRGFSPSSAEAQSADRSLISAGDVDVEQSENTESMNEDMKDADHANSSPELNTAAPTGNVLNSRVASQNDDFESSDEAFGLIFTPTNHGGNNFSVRAVEKNFLSINSQHQDQSVSDRRASHDDSKSSISVATDHEGDSQIEVASSSFISSSSSTALPTPGSLQSGRLPKRVAVRQSTSGSGSGLYGLGPPRRVSSGEGRSSVGRQSVDDTKPALTLQERLDEYRKWDMDDFVVTKNLGKGKFGNVYLAKEKHSGVTVALKVLYKSPLIRDGGIVNLKREVELQSRLQHPNVLRMFGYFYDESCVYLILEYASHGELYKLLQKEKYFSEAYAAHYVSQVVDALAYLHSCHVIHRDIKPENLLMGSNHTIKLADFGWSVHAPKEFARRRTFCGTPAYLSPEMLSGDEYDNRVDVWTVGVLAYEFLFGTTPFQVENQVEMYKRIENVEFEFPNEPVVSESARRFISNLLQKRPDDRMSLQDAQSHEWLRNRAHI